GDAMRAARRMCFGRGLTAVRLGGDAFFAELLPPAEGEPSLAEPNLVFSDVPTSRFDLRFGKHPCRSNVGIVEPREHLALFDGHPFLDVHLDDFAGDFRRHGRAAPRRHVARRVQDRGLGPGDPFSRSRSLNLDWPFPVRPDPGARADDGKDDESERPLQPTAHTGSVWRTLDAKRRQVLFQILHGTLSVSKLRPNPDDSLKIRVRLPPAHCLFGERSPPPGERWATPGGEYRLPTSRSDRARRSEHPYQTSRETTAVHLETSGPGHWPDSRRSWHDSLRQRFRRRLSGHPL